MATPWPSFWQLLVLWRGTGGGKSHLGLDSLGTRCWWICSCRKRTHGLRALRRVTKVCSFLEGKWGRWTCLRESFACGPDCSPCAFTLPVYALFPLAQQLKTTQILVVLLIYMSGNCKGIFPTYMIQYFLITWCTFASVEPPACCACRTIYILSCLGTTFRTVGIQPFWKKVFKLWKQAIKT